MYKVMLVDDEQIMIDSLKYIIENNFNDVEIVATARSGRESIEKAETCMPDIVFMDIGIPGINGLDAMSEIKSRFNQILFIILTAYDQFDFVKEALHLGAIEYLLKPVNRVKVIETMKMAKEHVFGQNEKYHAELKLKERLENVLPILEPGFIYSLVFMEDSIKDLLNYRQIFEWNEKGGYVMTVEFGEHEGGGELGNKIGYSVRSQNFYPMFRETIRHKRKCIVGPVMLNRIVVFFPENLEKDEYELRIDGVNLAGYIINTFSGKIGDGIKIGIGRAYDNYELIPTSYNESLTALQYLNGTGAMHISDLPSYSRKCYGYPVQKEKLLISRASKGDAEGCLTLLKDIYGWLTVTYPAQPLKIKNKLIEIITLISRTVWNDSEDENPGDMFLLEELLAMEDLTELGLWFNKKVGTLVSRFSQMNSSKISNLTKTAQRYIEENYSHPITLEDVAYKVNISPQYFSRLFKEEAGENFIDYLTRLRIKVAKSLLEGTEYNVKEICFRTGYGDPNYFSRIFKKATGLTPTEYKDKFSASRQVLI